MKLISGKKGGAELLLELVIATIIFFIVVVILFSVDTDISQFDARAHVRTADGALVCTSNLMSILKSKVPDTSILSGTTYSDYILYSYMNGTNDSWKALEEDLTTTTFILFPSSTEGKLDIMLNVSASEYNGKYNETIWSMGNIESEDVTNCSAYLPFPPARMERCGFSGVCELSTSSDTCYLTDKNINLTITLDSDGDGTSDGQTIEVGFEPEWAPVSRGTFGIPDLNINQAEDTSDLDSFSFDVVIDDDNDKLFDDRSYHISVVETSETEALVSVDRGIDVSECGIKVTLIIPTSKRFESVDPNKMWQDYCNNAFENNESEPTCTEYLCRQRDYESGYCDDYCSSNSDKQVCKEYKCSQEQTEDACGSICTDYPKIKPCVSYLGTVTEDESGR